MIHQVYTAKIRGTDVRFFPPQSDEELMPWVALDELTQAMGLDARQRAGATAVASDTGGRLDFKRIGTSKGFTNIISFSSAKGLIQGCVHMGYLPKAFEDDFVHPVCHAARQIHPEFFDETDAGEWVINMAALPRLLGTDRQHLDDFMKQNEDLYELRGDTWMPRARH
jgi:hypothetical protein